MKNLVVEYLSERLGKVIFNTKKKQAYGPLYLAKILKDEDGEIYEEDLEHLVNVATNIILHKAADDPSGKKGEALLTHTAISIGVEVANFKRVELNKPVLLHIGDLFIEAFYHSGFITIEIQEGFAPRSGSPYVIQITDKFSDLVQIKEAKGLILYSTGSMIPEIKNILQGDNLAVIKGINSEVSKIPLILHQQDFKQAIRNNAPWVQSLNRLQQQPWMVNRDVLKVIENNLDTILPEAKKRLDKAKKSDVDAAYKLLKEDPSEDNKESYNKAALEWNEELVVLRDISKRTELEAIFNKAKMLSIYPEFYQYVDVDYRGRVYYKEPFFNFQGSDMARALFLFKEGKPLGVEGLKWLYIHTASCYNQSYDVDHIPDWCSYDYVNYLKDEGLESISVDKMTLKDREEWTKQNIDLVFDSANKILNCEKPFSFLACCIEVRNACHNTNYISHLPIPIDGSCNGYQHSAAISKDEHTGALVSLTPTDIQADLYVKAAKALIERMPEWFEARPDMKMKHIRKYITKRGTMTRAYSAGAEKIADSMYADCYTGGITDRFNITMVDCEELARNLILALEDVCPGATHTMQFLQSLVNFEVGKTSAYDMDGSDWTQAKKRTVHARKQALKKKKDKTLDEQLELAMIEDRLNHVKDTRYVSYGNGKHYLSWVTPSGFPVFYHSYLTREQNVYVTLSGVPIGHKKDGEYTGRITHILQEPSSYASLQGLMSGISPNYIHSQDASHMAIVISNWTGSFGAVHDSFSTHARDVEDLAKLTRRCFVSMYSGMDLFVDIAENILSSTDNFDKELPVSGNLDINQVLQSEYFFC